MKNASTGGRIGGSTAAFTNPRTRALQGIADELKANLKRVPLHPLPGDRVAKSCSGADLHPNLNLVLSRAHVGILHRDLDRGVLVVNQRYCELVGRSAEELAGRSFEEFTHPDDLERNLTAYAAHLERAEPFEIEKRYIRPDGTVVWCRVHVSFVTDESGRAVSTITVAQDITDYQRTLGALKESEERLRLAAEAAGLGILDYDAVRKVRTWSVELTAMLGLPPDVEPSLPLALSCVVPEDRHLVEPLFNAERARDGNFSFQATFRIRRADDGRERWLTTGGWRTLTDGDRLSRVVLAIRDITDERTAEERVRWTATHDALTDLPNRGCFVELLDKALASAEADQVPVALLLLDVDRLKETNDVIGHDAGDLLLRTFSDRVRQAVPEGGIVARLGGDEFAVLLPHGDEQAVDELAGRLMPILRQPFTVQGYTLDCQATGGIALYPKHGTTPADLLKSADIALYVGKATQRGRVAVFKAEMRAGLQRRASMLRVARTVVGDNLVVPVYQPKVALEDGALAGFEALLRWRHPRLGIQGPDSIAVAFEDIDLATALSERMLHQILKDMRSWLDRGLEFGRVAFNLSPAEFRSGNLLDRILGRLEQARIPPSRLELEVTETVFLGSGAEKVEETLKAFHAAGVSIALDDFGTGYASLTHLKTFPVDVIKIDRSFISSLAEGPGDAAIVRAIIGLGQDLGMEVVAEGVETEAQAAALRELGCTFAQGYLFGRGMPAGPASAWIAGPNGGSAAEHAR